jgi:cyclophilin family peptidyl-prolyl cis-trans isomerase
MKSHLLLTLFAWILVLGHSLTLAIAQEPPPQAAEVSPSEGGKQRPSDLIRADKALVNDPQKPGEIQSAEQAKAAFDNKFREYKGIVREIENLQVEFQNADESKREGINAAMSGQVAHAQAVVNEMVEAAMEVYRLAPNADPQVTELLTAVARHYTIGRQIGPGQPARGGHPEDVYYPIDGGDQYERALPLIKLLIDGGAEEKDLSTWGFLSAFATNNYELAKQYLAKAQETGAFEALAETAGMGESDPQSGLMKGVLQLVSAFAGVLDDYPQLWAKEAALREAEAATDDLPRIKLTTTKGEIVLELFENEAPQSVANFLTLVKQGFYNGTPFHRVLPRFMAQGGDPTGTGTGGPGYSIRGEADAPNHRNHFRGSLSMAHSGHPDSGGSQFFLTFVPTPHLNGRHTAFGRVIEGIEALGDLQRRSPQHQPDAPEADRILTAEVLRDRGHKYAFEKLPER